MDLGLSDLKTVFCVNLPQHALLKQNKTSLWNLRLGNVHGCENGGNLEFVMYLEIIRKYLRGT